jgi:hypothetical protein
MQQKDRRHKSKDSLQESHPEIALEWHSTRNGQLQPCDIVSGSGKKIWWSCEYGHEWEAKCYSRTSLSSGCPFCVGKRVNASNCLAKTNNRLAMLWHPIKNGFLTPNDVTQNSGKKVWFLCPEGNDHEWQACIATVNSALQKNAATRGCPVCRGLKIVLSNSLMMVYSNLANEWHPGKNGHLKPLDVHYGSHKRVWWLCAKNNDHEWQASIKQRAAGNGCPMCRGSVVVPSNSLATMNPGLAQEWHPYKNGFLSSLDVHMGSHKKVWWQCLKNVVHEWMASIDNRKNGSGCPFCAHQIYSRGNRQIEAWLISAGINFEREKTFHNLRSFKGSHHRLKFDFFLPDCKTIIEFDGKQHFEPVTYFGGEESYQNLLKNDQRKNEWAYSNGHKLIRISFKDIDQVEHILSNAVTIFR